MDWKYSNEPDGQSCLAMNGGRCSWHRGKAIGKTLSQSISERRSIFQNRAKGERARAQNALFFITLFDSSLTEKIFLNPHFSCIF